MLSAAVVVSYGLGTGFDRAARAAELPDVIVRFDDIGAAATWRARIEALPDIARYALRLEIADVGIRFDGQRVAATRSRRCSTRPGRVRAMRSSRAANLGGRGSECSSSRRSRRRGGSGSGTSVTRARVSGRAGRRARGGARRRRLPAREAPLLPVAPRDRCPLRRPERYPQVNLAEIWLRNPAYLNEVLAQARATSFGLQGHPLRDAVGAPHPARPGGGDRDRPARRAVGDRAGDGRRDARGVGAGGGAAAARRDRGAPRGRRDPRPRDAVGSQVVEGLLVSVPFCDRSAWSPGLLVTLSAGGPVAELLNEPPPGWRAVRGRWRLAWLARVALIPALGAAWPAWRATGGSVVTLLRGRATSPRRGSAVSRRARAAAPGGGLVGLGVRLVGARRARLARDASSRLGCRRRSCC